MPVTTTTTTTTQYDICGTYRLRDADMRFNAHDYLCAIYTTCGYTRAVVLIPAAHSACGLGGLPLCRALGVHVTTAAKDYGICSCATLDAVLRDVADAVLAVTHAASRLRAIADAWREVDPKIAARTTDTTLD